VSCHLFFDVIFSHHSVDYFFLILSFNIVLIWNEVS
jgi:hypothetical protein